MTPQPNKAKQKESSDRGSPKPDLSRAVGGGWGARGLAAPGPGTCRGPADSAGRRTTPGTPVRAPGQGLVGRAEQAALESLRQGLEMDRGDRDGGTSVTRKQRERPTASAPSRPKPGGVGGEAPFGRVPSRVAGFSCVVSPSTCSRVSHAPPPGEVPATLRPVAVTRSVPAETRLPPTPVSCFPSGLRCPCPRICA